MKCHLYVEDRSRKPSDMKVKDKVYETYEEWMEEAEIVSPTLQVGPMCSHRDRSFWNMNGQTLTEDVVLPHNWFKRQQAYADIDLALLPTKEHKALAAKYGGELVEHPYCDDDEPRYYPSFELTDAEYKADDLDAHMKRAFNYIKEYRRENK